jgi:ubiquinone biosynthesis protein
MSPQPMRTFRLVPPPEPMPEEASPAGKLKGGYLVPQPLPDHPREERVSQEWLTRWDEGTWGVVATLKLLTPVSLRAMRSWLFKGSRPRFWAELRVLMESLGGLWVEIGLLLAKRPDLIGEAAQAEMAKLRPPVNEFPVEVAELLFLKQFGESVEDRFARFDPRPVSIGVFSQTYRGRLRDPDIEVAVKVLRPDVAALLQRDLGILRTVMRIGGWVSAVRALGFGKLQWEIEQWLIQWSDLRYQAASLRRIRGSLKRHKVYVPRVFLKASSNNFLTTEFLAGPTLADVQRLCEYDPEQAQEWMRANGIKPCKLGRRIFQSYMRQALQDNLFHCELSPANIVLLQNSRFALATAGPVAALDKQFATYQSQMFRAIATSDYSKAVDYLFLTCDALPRVGQNELRIELVRLYRSFEMRSELHGVGFSERSFGALSSEISAVMFRNGVARSWQGVNLDRGWTNLEQSLQFLDPEFNLREELQRYFRAADRMNSSIVGKEGVRVKIGRLVASLSEHAMFLGVQLRRRAQSFEGISKASYIAAVFFRAILRIVALALVGMAAARFGLHYKLPFLEGTWVHRLALSVESQPKPILALLVAMGLYTLVILRGVVARLMQRERRG